MSTFLGNWHKVVDKLIATCYNMKYQRQLYIVREEDTYGAS